MDAPAPGLYYAGAANGTDALSLFEGERPLFSVGNQAREPWHIHRTALVTALIGPGWLAAGLP